MLVFKHVGMYHWMLLIPMHPLMFSLLPLTTLSTIENDKFIRTKFVNNHNLHFDLLDTKLT